MSFANVNTYFRARAKEVGYHEHTDAFNFSNIPNSTFDKTFHIDLGDFQGSAVNQTNLDTKCSVTVRLFINGRRNVKTVFDTAIAEGEKLVKKCLKASNRLTGGLKNVSFDSMAWSPFDESNDNLIVVACKFTAETIIDVES